MPGLILTVALVRSGKPTTGRAGGGGRWIRWEAPELWRWVTNSCARLMASQGRVAPGPDDFVGYVGSPDFED